MEDDNRPLTQEQIARELGCSVTQLKDLKRLQNLSPELQELISDGKITPTTGYKLLTRLEIANLNIGTLALILYANFICCIVDSWNNLE